MRGEGRFTWLAPTLAAAAFIVLALLFAREMRAFSGAVGNWAQRDLESRAEVAARTLEEPLATQDFRAIRAFAESCRSNGLDFCVRAGGGGTVFDTRRQDRSSGPAFVAERQVGEYRFSLFLPAARVQAPFRRAIPGFAIAALLGVVGMLFVFFVVYRQRVRIRELARLERFRREFVADVSHEIKTPLTGILGAVDLLGEAEAGPAELRGRLLGMIRKESARLNGLVQSILDLARLEREGEVLNRSETDLAELVRETAESFRARAEAAGVELTVDAPASLPAACDAQLIAQALGNLVANALRHAQSPTVRVTCARDGSLARLAVEDRGIGIPPAEAARVFERFHRVDPSRAAETGGAGLGLAIVRRILRLHGGDVALEPVVPHGCRMVLSFPLG